MKRKRKENVQYEGRKEKEADSEWRRWGHQMTLRRVCTRVKTLNIIWLWERGQMYSERFSDCEELRLQGGRWCFTVGVMTACWVLSGEDEGCVCEDQFEMSFLESENFFADGSNIFLLRGFYFLCSSCGLNSVYLWVGYLEHLWAVSVYFCQCWCFRWHCISDNISLSVDVVRLLTNSWFFFLLLLWIILSIKLWEIAKNSILS